MTSMAMGKGPRRRRLVHAAMDAYLEWRDQCTAASDAYRRWADAADTNAATAWLAYETALDREERASIVYAELVAQVDQLAAPDRKLGPDLAISGETLR
jgi:hypothetical protein